VQISENGPLSTSHCARPRIQGRGGYGRELYPSDENALGGFPTLQSGTPCQDSDGDGIPDARELANSLDPNNSADAHWIGAMGYTYMEHFLNGSNSR